MNNRIQIQYIYLFGILGIAAGAFGGETLYNGIELPDRWPPNVRSIGDEPSVPPYLQNPPEVIPVDVGRQLFVDDFLIENTTLTRKFHQAKLRDKPVLWPDRPWESKVAKPNDPPQAMPFSGGVWFDPQDKRFKMWYQAGFSQSICYAESPDGIRWKKPKLDVVPGTNIVYDVPHDSSTIWLDHEAAPDQRFKMMTRENVSGQHVIRHSADGIHWSGPVIASGAAFDRSTFFYNPFRNRWVLSLRTDAYNPATETASGTFAGRDETPGGMKRLPRARRYVEAKTLLEAARAWPADKFDSAPWYVHATEPILWTGADRLDPPRPGIGTTPELYNLDAVAYESLMVGLFSIWRGKPAEYPGRDKINDICIGFSRDGFHWDRPSREPIIPVSDDPKAWNYSNVQSAGGCLLVVGDKLYIYASGRQTRETNVRKGVSSTGLATMRRDGFASMDAAGPEGVLTTRTVRFSGKHLFVNANVKAGELRAEILDQQGKIIAKYAREKCVPISADSTAARVSWKGAEDISELAGKPVNFRFFIKNGSLYSFWVSPDQSGASYGYVGAGGPQFSGPLDAPKTEKNATERPAAAKKRVEKLVDTILLPSRTNCKGVFRWSEGTILNLDGKKHLVMLVSAFGEGGHDDTTADILRLDSLDGGLSWTPLEKAEVFQKNIGGQNVMAPSLLRLKNGDILCILNVMNSDTDGGPWMKRSADNGKTWSKLEKLPYRGYGNVCNDRAMQLSNGRILLPCWCSTDKLASCQAYCLYSDDDGRTWKQTELINAPKGSTGRKSDPAAEEPMVVELKNSRLMMVLRVYLKSIYVSYSDDMGATWSTPRSSNIPAPGSMTTITRMPDGNILLIWNWASPEKINGPWPRNFISSAVSTDDGKTFGHVRHLDGGENYPGKITMANVVFCDGNAVITYSNSPSPKNTYDWRLQVIPLAWFYEGDSQETFVVEQTSN